MSIEVIDIVTQKARKFGASEQDPQFRALVIDAINYALDDTENLVGVSTDRISPQDQTIDIDKQKYMGTLSMGVDFYIQDTSEFQIQPMAGVESRYRDKIKTARMRYEDDIDIHTKRGNMSDD